MRQLDELGPECARFLETCDLILHGGGFRMLILDLCDLPQAELQRVPPAWWHRLRLSVENTTGVVLAASASDVGEQRDLDAGTFGELSDDPPVDLGIVELHAEGISSDRAGSAT